jgi:cytidylate kinase
MASTYPVIAIDGTAASGKSTFARSLAQHLGYAYVNTGAMYRGVTWHLLKKGIPLEHPEAVAQAFGTLAVETRLERSELSFLIDGEDPLPHLRDGRVNAGVSLVASVPAVRRLLVAQQQALASESSLVMEGRDIGTVVFPETPYKFFIDAAAEVRADRRRAQGETDVILERDAIDQKRQDSPLTCAPDALRLDSGSTSVEELVSAALRHLALKGYTAKPATL